MNIIEAIEHKDLFAPLFTSPSWAAWMIVLRVMFGLPLSDDDLKLFYQCTGRRTPPKGAFKEAWLICGRRAGKSFMMALIAVFLACFYDYKPFLNIGERATIMIIAADRKQARVVLRYIRGLLCAPPIVKMVTREWAEGFDLNNRVTIEVHTASFSTTRGYTVVAALLDEIAFWGGDDSSVPDTEIVRALRPAMALIPNAMMICASSPYARKGALWKAYDRHYGKDESNIFVWKAPTTLMNSLFPQETVDEAIEEDPEAAKTEYLAEFRNDIASYVDADVVDNCVLRGVYEIPHVMGGQYVAFTDPSGGHSDSFTLGIATSRMDLDVQVCQLVCVREWRPPFNPSQVIEEICNTLHVYGINSVTSDRYAGEFPAEHFRNHGITLEPSEKPKSDIYRDALPLLNSGRVELLDSKRLIAQICGLERRVARGGRDSIDHAPHGRDDVANSALGALVLASGMSADGFSLDMYLRAYGLKPTLYEERAQRKAQEEAERREREDAERRKQQAVPTPESHPSTCDDSNQPKPADHRAPCDVRLLQS
jgi:hypothetical protein